MATICIFGDSITWGATDPEKGGWANRLRNYFESQGGRVDEDVDVYNLGVSGDNTDDLKLRFEVEARARKPDAIVFAIGINDAQFVISKNGNRVPLEEFSKNITGLINQAKTIAEKVIVVGLTRVDESKTVPIPWNQDKKYLNGDIERYDATLRDVSESLGVLYVDVSKVVSTVDLPDGLHPNSVGHQRLFETTKDFLV
jgi:lysophospholipase L1-like esterase